MTAQVTLQVFDIAGRLVCSLVNAQQARGSYEIAWDGTNANGTPMGNGVYFYRLETTQFRDTKKVILIR